MDVGFRDVRDPKMFLCRRPEILIDRAAGIDDQRFSAGRAAQEETRLRQLGVEESAKDHDLCDLFATLRTNFNPDHTSSIAQTLTSTRPSSNPWSRMTFSLRSLSTPELFFGQEIQSPPSSASARAIRGRLAPSSRRERANR